MFLQDVLSLLALIAAPLSALSAAVTIKNPFVGNSATPTFTEEEKNMQKEAGKQLMEQVRTAANDLSVSSYTIPVGNYGFDMTISVDGLNPAFVLYNVNRSDNNPFTIDASGVTFWFELSGEACPAFSRCVQLVNCSNIIINGLTVDSYSANSIEGALSRIDTSKNRIAIHLYPGAMHLDAATIAKAVAGSECRIVPIKANGDGMAPLYNVDNTWGPGAMQVSSVVSTGKNDEYWLTFKNSTLLSTIFTSIWKDTYGSIGVLEIGDGICLLYGTIMFALDNCKHITINGLNCYISKCGFWENGGYGDHMWKNCYFGPRPGTNRILGGEGNMSQGLRHGSTYDNITINFTTDDAINIHGFWSKITSVSSSSIRCNYAPVGIEAGDTAEFRDASGKLVATGTVAATPHADYNYNGFLNSSIMMKSPPPSNWSSLSVRWPASECDGWKIINSTFKNVYQRILINSGSGAFENNTVLNMGDNLALTSNTASYEGGVMKNITIRNNVFYNCANWPGANTVELSQTPNWASYVNARNIILTSNAFVNCGKLFTSANIIKLNVSSNLMIQPVIYGRSSVDFNTLCSSTATSGLTLTGNSLYTVDGSAAGGDNPQYTLSRSKLQSIQTLCKNHADTAANLIRKIRNLL
jgi:hypothetical protein